MEKVSGYAAEILTETKGFSKNPFASNSATPPAKLYSGNQSNFAVATHAETPLQLVAGLAEFD